LFVPVTVISYVPTPTLLYVIGVFWVPVPKVDEIV
jgi:hypothetical protein